MFRPGHPFSTSPNACMIRFTGGPYDGQSGLYDHAQWNGINVCIQEEEKTYSYTKAGPRHYRLDKVWSWK
jgi:hypothetical protein